MKFIHSQLDSLIGIPHGWFLFDVICLGAAGEGKAHVTGYWEFIGHGSYMGG